MQYIFVYCYKYPPVTQVWFCVCERELCFQCHLGAPGLFQRDTISSSLGSVLQALLTRALHTVLRLLLTLVIATFHLGIFARWLPSPSTIKENQVWDGGSHDQFNTDYKSHDKLVQIWITHIRSCILTTFDLIYHRRKW